MLYTIGIARPAQRQLKKLDAPTRIKIGLRIERLAEDPRPPGVVKLTDVSPPIYRIRDGQYRILYTIDDDKLIVLVVRIGHRSEVYR
jgi:mRNA interferase RelE/StbE